MVVENRLADLLVPFGRHRGKPLSSLSIGCLRWIARQLQHGRHSQLAHLANQLLRQRIAFQVSSPYHHHHESPDLLLTCPPQYPPKLLLHDIYQIPVSDTAIASLLRWCASAKSLEHGTKLVRLYVLREGLQNSDPSVVSLIVRMYAECGALDEARAVCAISESILSWNFIIGAYAAQPGALCGGQALEAFCDMLRNGIAPDKVTILHVLAVCGKYSLLPDGRLVHCIVVFHDLLSDTSVTNSIISMYGQCGSLDDAVRNFEQSEKYDVITWNALLSGYVLNNLSDRALLLFLRMQKQCVNCDNVTYIASLDACAAIKTMAQGQRIHVCVLADNLKGDVVVGTTLINMYGKCGRIEHARKSFENIPQRNTVCWTAMIAAYAHNKQSEDALHLFSMMDVPPTKVTFINVLDACADIPNLYAGKILHERIKKSGFMGDVRIGTALIKMYGRCGAVENARFIFNGLPVCDLDLAAWNAMIATYAQHGLVDIVLQLFPQMSLHRARPNVITYVSILSVCSHEGLLNEACELFSSMHEYNVSPIEHHYNCIIDLLARAGRLDEAELLVHDRASQSLSFIPAMTLFSACKNQADVDRGVRMANLIFQLGVRNEDPHLIMSSIRAECSVQAVHQAAEIHRAVTSNEMVDSGVNIHGPFSHVTCN